MTRRKPLFCQSLMPYLPGKYDQRGDSAEQCVQLLTQGERCKVLTARVIALKGNITDEELVKVEEYLINPVESRLASLEKPKTLDYFRDTEHRDPSVTELRVIDTYWSDHCRHTTFLTRLEEIEIEKSALGKVIEDALSEYYATRDEVYGKDTGLDPHVQERNSQPPDRNRAFRRCCNLSWRCNP